MTLYQFARIVELRTKIVSISSFSLGILAAVASSGRFLPGRTGLMVAAVLAVDMGTTAFNTFFDYWTGVDRQQTNREADKVLVHQRVAPGIALIVALILYALAIILGLLLAILVNPLIAPAGALCLAVGFLYNGGPRPISRTPWGEFFAGGFLGWFLLCLTIFVHNGGIAPGELLLGIPSGFFIASILTVNNTCDIQGDALAGRKTLSIQAGRNVGESLVYIQGFLAYGSLFILGWAGFLHHTAQITAPLFFALSIPLYALMHRQGFSHETKSASMQRISAAFLLFSVSLALPLGLAALESIISGGQ
ncbi:1,4-dihydroxy-2-naphthoate octaprenyltransferase [Alkalispirochaeta americana]|uniref:1,4-dihydroxy-2-naphthoate octaprenyltransferase n=1 Tax=Alkalispirochaeta americana TaxID=159291 RepID=A0A1N6QW29_9SPIO|nr:prenyltransferase [Alkalispirochaeta americana]SIQ20840.1 1,4-dihydroxy-2-naphthoate octaprenyltransferase [Alkalispirochaeta americana]